MEIHEEKLFLLKFDALLLNYEDDAIQNMFVVSDSFSSNSTTSALCGPCFQ